MMQERDAIKVLMIDDDAHTLRIAAEYLRGRGLQVVTSTIPFVAPLIQHESPQIIVLDLKMPLMGGRQLLGILRRTEFGSNIPILFFSAEKEQDLRRIAAEEGVAGFVSKEQGLEMLAMKIREVVVRG